MMLFQSFVGGFKGAGHERIVRINIIIILSSSSLLLTAFDPSVGRTACCVCTTLFRLGTTIGLGRSLRTGSGPGARGQIRGTGLLDFTTAAATETHFARAATEIFCRRTRSRDKGDGRNCLSRADETGWPAAVTAVWYRAARRYALETFFFFFLLLYLFARFFFVFFLLLLLLFSCFLVRPPPSQHPSFAPDTSLPLRPYRRNVPNFYLRSHGPLSSY